VVADVDETCGLEAVEDGFGGVLADAGRGGGEGGEVD